MSTDFNPLDMIEGVDRVLAATAEGVQREVQNGIKKAINKASPPSSKKGQNPRKRTGNLGRSVLLTRMKDIGGVKYGTIHIDAPYARNLEYGVKLPGGQPYFISKKISKSQGNPIPGTDIAFAKKSSPHAWRMAKTKPGKLEPRPFVSRQVKKTKKRMPIHIKKMMTKVRQVLSAGRKMRKP